MASLLAKFRIDYSDLKVIPDITKKPQEASKAFFDNLISDFMTKDNNSDGNEDENGTMQQTIANETEFCSDRIMIVWTFK